MTVPTPFGADDVRIIPSDWSAAHRDLVTTSMNATCRITDPARAVRGPWDEETGTWGPDTPYVVADGIPCRVQQHTSSGAASVWAGLKDHEHPYLVAIPWTVQDVQTDYLIEVTSAPNDHLLVGVVLHVDQVLKGSEQWDRDLICTEHQG